MDKRNTLTKTQLPRISKPSDTYFDIGALRLHEFADDFAELVGIGELSERRRPQREENLLLRLLQERDMACVRRLTPFSERAATCKTIMTRLGGTRGNGQQAFGVGQLSALQAGQVAPEAE
ncbi:hypothetical protein EYF80_014673 [Liparis tanakae]|uniref:Uncharacterized protein n=1 Tax=Liparis tanakae TaxID=230148 RepID=A0A4Z2IB30_9TELE|nr:hypothetical protein EYF80_014673 [Liparis tanakae]